MSNSTASPLTAQDVFDILAVNKILLSEKQQQLLLKWAALFAQTNENINLVSRKDMIHFWEHHVLHSLAVLKHCPLENVPRVLDFGTGGGIPGIPLAIARPECQFTLLDATQKKIRAVELFREELTLNNVVSIAKRGEEWKLNDQQKFNIIISRAVASAQQIDQWTKDLRMKNATLWLYKGGDLAAEIWHWRKTPQKMIAVVHPLQFLNYPTFEKEEKKLLELKYL